MIRSIRLRLQLWYGLVLVAAVAGFAAVLYLEVHAGRVRDLDAELQMAAAQVETELRPVPPWMLDGRPEPPPGPDGRPPPPDGRPPPRDSRPPPPGPDGRDDPEFRPPPRPRPGPPPPRLTKDEVLARLNPTAAAAAPGESPARYVGVWRE